VLDQAVPDQAAPDPLFELPNCNEFRDAEN
jgi:hypothetical protein